MKNLMVTVVVLLWVSAVYGQEDGFHLDKEYKINKNGVIDLTSSDARVFITGSIRSTAHLKIDRKVTAKGLIWGDDNFQIDVHENDGDLSIQEKQTGSRVSVAGYYNEEYRIELEIPDGVSLKVRGDDGDYYIKNVNGSIRLNLDDADAELAGCKGSDFEFRLDDGDVRMDEGKGKIEIVAGDADIEIYKGNFSSIRARIDDGDLNIETFLANDGDYSIESQDGTISLNVLGGGGEFIIRHDDSHVITDGDFKVLSKSEDETRVSVNKGTAKVSIRADDAHVKLRAR